MVGERAAAMFSVFRVSFFCKFLLLTFDFDTFEGAFCFLSFVRVLNTKSTPNDIGNPMISGFLACLGLGARCLSPRLRLPLPLPPPMAWPMDSSAFFSFRPSSYLVCLGVLSTGAIIAHRVSHMAQF